MRVAVAMSGGMDSTATALLLRNKGHDVIGFHMRLHSHSDTTWEQARMSAEKIDVPIREIDLREDFAETVIRPFVEEYSLGRTPSPCPICNRFIKMSFLLEEARSLECGRLATGHYARILSTLDGLGLFKGLDSKKDQSYFLFMLTRELLAGLIFPLGDHTKAWVKEFLNQEGLDEWESEESQELCFMQARDYRDFLRQRRQRSLPGPITDLHGTVIGRHKGVMEYTVGQRKGLGICRPHPMYVIRIDAATNTVVVGPKEDTFSPGLIIRDINLLTKSPPYLGERFLVKVRSTAEPVGCTVTYNDRNHMKLTFDEPQSAIAPGQAAVLYKEDRVIGGGWIESPTRPTEDC
jgi:tRNA-specific 2-thiouridylase